MASLRLAFHELMMHEAWPVAPDGIFLPVAIHKVPMRIRVPAQEASLVEDAGRLPILVCRKWDFDQRIFELFCFSLIRTVHLFRASAFFSVKAQHSE